MDINFLMRKQYFTFLAILGDESHLAIASVTRAKSVTGE